MVRRGVLGCAGVSLAIVAWIEPRIALCLSAGIILFGRFRVQRRRTQSLRRRDELIGLLERSALRLQSGASLQRAFEDEYAGSWSAALAGTRAELVSARRVSRAPWAQVDPIGGVVADAFDVLATLGAPSAAVLFGLGETLRKDRDLIEDVVTAASQAELSALVVTMLPLGFLGFLAASGMPMLSVFLARPVGRVACVLGIAGSLLAWAWMRRLIVRVCDV